MPKIDTLLKLIAEARDEAERLGPVTAGIARRLEEAIVEARGLAAKGGEPDQGKRPDELSSANDG
jgi:hypothetical protein